MMYRVIRFFHDLQDGDHPYNVGDIFPREGAEATEQRIAELSGSGNKQGKPLIEPVEEPKKPAKRKPKKAEAEE